MKLRKLRQYKVLYFMPPGPIMSENSSRPSCSKIMTSVARKLLRFVLSNIFVRNAETVQLIKSERAMDSQAVLILRRKLQ
jgi:hypothetical protein